MENIGAFTEWKFSSIFRVKHHATKAWGCSNNNNFMDPYSEKNYINMEYMNVHQMK